MPKTALTDYPWGAWKWEFDCDIPTARRLCLKASRRYNQRFAYEVQDGVLYGFTVLQPGWWDWSKDVVKVVGNSKRIALLAKKHNRKAVRKGNEWHLIRQEEFEDIVAYPWDTAEVGDDFRLSLACEKWRAKQMVRRHSRKGKKFVLYYGIVPVRHLRVRRMI